LVAALPDDPEKPEPIYLDFAGVAVATGSYLREGVIGGKPTFIPSSPTQTATFWTKFWKL
jgi:hypothetical protein